jgi:predicted hotdog family 3-hydroxylacyl-ACP dehydratase
MIDQLISCDENCSVTTFLIEPGNILVNDGELTEAGIIENIAQTAAAGLGYITLHGNEAIFIAYIAAVNDLEIFALPKTGDIIETRVTIKTKVFDVVIISGSIKCKEALIAECEMKIFFKK